MNEDMHWRKVGIFIAAALGIAAIVFVVGRSRNTDDQTMLQTAPVPSAAQPEKVIQPDNTYVNTKYGFSLTLPKSWKKEKAFTKEVVIPEFIDNELGVSLGYVFEKEIPDIGAGTYMYNVYIIPLADWKKIDPEVVRELGRNMKYVFGISPSNDLMATNQNGGQSICTEHANEQKEFCRAYNDLKGIVSNPENLKKLDFKAFQPRLVDTTDWKTYRNEQYGFEFKYPEGYELGLNKSGWPHAVGLLILAGGYAQSYDLAIEVWKSRTELRNFLNESTRSNDANDMVIRDLTNGEIITFLNQNKVEEIDQVIDTFKLIR